LRLRDPAQYLLRPEPAERAAPEPERGARMPQPRPFHRQVAAAAKAHGLDPALVHAVIAAESSYNAHAISPRGAIGLMQVMPELGERYGVSADELRDPARNIHTGTRHLSELMQAFGGDLLLALAGYNAGEYAVLRHGRQVPPYAETRNYVLRVLQFYGQLRADQVL
jgi:soluble lytic murein transglycosylase-like protein